MGSAPTTVPTLDSVQVVQVGFQLEHGETPLRLVFVQVCKLFKLFSHQYIFLYFQVTKTRFFSLIQFILEQLAHLNNSATSLPFSLFKFIFNLHNLIQIRIFLSDSDFIFRLVLASLDSFPRLGGDSVAKHPSWRAEAKPTTYTIVVLTIDNIVNAETPVCRIDLKAR